MAAEPLSGGIVVGVEGLAWGTPLALREVQMQFCKLEEQEAAGGPKRKWFQVTRGSACSPTCMPGLSLSL